ncbi:MAG: hypothetical protein ACK4HE_07150 [Chitinophagaceae bacterium]
MMYVRGLLITGIVFSIISIQAQPVRYASNVQRLFFCHSNAGPSFSKILAKAGDRNTLYITNDDIDIDNDGKANLSDFKKAVELKVANKNYSGIVTIDWEGVGYNYLKFATRVRKDSADFIINEYLKLIRIGKQLLPKAQWGIYDIPFATYWSWLSDTWKQRIDLMDRLLKEVDVLMPCLYDYYPASTTIGKQYDSLYITQCLQKSLQKSVQFKKPVMVWVWHRYHDYIEASGLQLIDTTEFIQHMRWIAQVQYKGKRVQGVIWWHEDLYFLRIKKPVLVAEQGQKTEQQFLDDAITPYYRLLTQVFKDQ